MTNGKRQLKPLRLAAALLAACVLAATAAETPAIPPVFHPSFQTASDAAAADQSQVLLIFSAEWCGPCKLLKSKTLSAPEFLEQENPLHIADVDVDASPEMARVFGIEAVPTLVLITADGKIISRQTGFMAAADLMAWLKAGRTRAAAGQWEGTAPGPRFNDFIKKATADSLGTNEIRQLVDLLGDADPANRDQAGKLLLAQRTNAVPSLIAAVGHPYLGVRIGASELLQRLAPDRIPIDPWRSPSEMSNTVIVLQEWWAETGRLPAPAAPPPPDLFSTNAIEEAVAQLRSDDPVRRTAAMTELVGRGADALPAVRVALKRAERSGDQRALGLLEDVRWTILVPAAVEQQSGGVRNVLARGKSSERQAATERLGRIGRDALGVLTELANDPDPLVVESAIRALSGISGKDAIPALATLLKFPDSNLRMTAAQALGRTKNSAAVKPLLEATADTDEVVACTALAALEETQSRESYRSSPAELSPEITTVLRRCLTDPRWRVRATAAEVVGKLDAGKMVDDLKKLLNDPDGFVAKNALTALGRLNATPESRQLVVLSKRLPSLQSDTVEMLLRSESEETVKTITELFRSGTPDTQTAILDTLAQKETSDESKTDAEWKPLLNQAITATDPRLRRGAAKVLGQLSPKLAAGMIGPLLADEDRETRLAAAKVVLRILDHDNGGQLSPRVYNSSSAPKTNKPAASAGQIAAWHTAMLKQADPVPTLDLAAAIYATGDGRTDLPMLLSVLDNTNRASAQDRAGRQTDMVAIELIVLKLPWPAGRPVLDKFAASPICFAMAASQSGRDKPEVVGYLLDPARFKSVVEPATGPALSETLVLLAGYDYEYREKHQWSLWSETDRTKAVALALVESTNAAWRAAAVFSLGLRADAKENLAVFEKAVADPDPWVRASGVRAIARNAKDRQILEQALAPRLADTNLPVATVAAVALLEPETRQAAGLATLLDYFQFQTVHGGRSSQSINQRDARPLAVLEGKPPFLALARERLSTAREEEVAPFALLLAQYGDFTGVDRLAARQATPNSGDDLGAVNALLAGIALSSDIKYLPALKQLASVRHEEWELQKILQALKGMSGPDARQLRLDINKKIRNAGGSSSGPPL